MCYDGSDIPDDNTRRNRGTGDRKRNQAPTGQNNTVRANIGQNSDRTHHTVNFDNREQTFKQTFLVCQNITRPVILGKDFTRDNCAGVHWMEDNTRMLTINLKKLIETPELLPR